MSYYFSLNTPYFAYILVVGTSTARARAEGSVNYDKLCKVRGIKPSQFVLPGGPKISQTDLPDELTAGKPNIDVEGSC